MVDSWIEDFVESYYRCYKKYLVQKNVWFRVPRRLDVRKQANWSDIDILALSDEELEIISCITFLGQQVADVSANKVAVWFEEAKDFIVKHEIYSGLLRKRNYILKKKLVLENPFPKAEGLIKKLDPDIEIIYYKDLLIAWLNFLKEEMKHVDKNKVYTKTEDPIERLLMEIIKYELVK